jgi:small conductance mechanosensitive channel
MPVTTSDPVIDLDHLRWRLKPLTKEELVVEADGWRDLLKEKVSQIAEAEIAVRRQNEQIDTAEDAAEAVKEASEAAAVVEEGGEAPDQAETEAAEKAEAARQALEEAKETAEEAQQDTASQTAKKLVEEVKEQQAEEEGETGPPAQTPVADVSIEEVAEEATEAAAATDAEALKSVAESAQMVAEQKTEEKRDFLETLAELRDQRAMLLERLNLVLLELKAKGGEVESYKSYMTAVSRDIIDVTDRSAVWTFVSRWVTSDQGGVKLAINVLKFVAVLLVFYVLAIVAGKAAEKATAKSRAMSTLLRGFVVTTARRGAMLVGLMIAISAMGVPIGPVLAVITAAGFVVGLALQGTLSNFASGLLILLYRPFDVGDAVDAGGVAGSVTAMNLMSTRIQTWDNKSMIVPNNQIWGSVITNITRTERRRVDMVFGIGYGDSMDKAQAILERIVQGHTDVLKDPAPTVKVHELGDSSVNFVVRPWVRPANYWGVYWDVTRKVKEEFDKEGVSIPFPQRDVHLYKTEGQPCLE